MSIEVIKYDPFYQLYHVGFSWHQFFETVSIPSELIDDALQNPQVIPFGKIKRILRESLIELKAAADQDE